MASRVFSIVSWSSIGIFTVCGLLMVGCNGRRDSEAPPPSKAPVDPSGAVAASLLDRVVTAESVFPDPAQRALYRMLSLVTERDRRSYIFQLIAQPGMNESRHFSLVTITWAPGGKWVQPTEPFAGTGGPNGGFVEVFAKTDDRAFDVKVMHGMLLPATVTAPPVSIEAIAASMVREYQKQKAK